MENISVRPPASSPAASRVASSRRARSAAMRHASQHRSIALETSLYMRPVEHAAHTTNPHVWQWYRRDQAPNRVTRHRVHTATSSLRIARIKVLPSAWPRDAVGDSRRGDSLPPSTPSPSSLLALPRLDSEALRLRRIGRSGNCGGGEANASSPRLRRRPPTPLSPRSPWLRTSSPMAAVLSEAQVGLVEARACCCDWRTGSAPIDWVRARG